MGVELALREDARLAASVLVVDRVERLIDDIRNAVREANLAHADDIPLFWQLELLRKEVHKRASFISWRGSCA